MPSCPIAPLMPGGPCKPGVPGGPGGPGGPMICQANVTIKTPNSGNFKHLTLIPGTSYWSCFFTKQEGNTF